MKKLLLSLLGLIIIFVIVLSVKTAMFTSRQEKVSAIKPVAVDKNVVALHLSEALKIPTISHQDRSKMDTKQYLKFHKFLEEKFPLVHRKLEREVINDYSLLFKWQGSDSTIKPVVFMAHIDVVPIEPGTESKWTHDAFSGAIADGFIWGRGAVDMKSTLVAEMEAVEGLLKEGFQPKRTYYFALGHDEEIGGDEGGKAIASHLKSKGVTFDFTIDEGMVILDETLSPAKRPTAVIGIAEKGYMTLKLTASGKGGHSSGPSLKTTLGTLAKAIISMEQNQMPASISGAAEKMFEYIGPEMPLLQKVLFANRWVFDSVIINQLENIPSMNAMLRTTTAPTMISGGVKENVLPTKAHVLINFRILPGDKPEDIIAHAKKVIDDPAVEVSIYKDLSTTPSPVSSVEATGFKVMKRTVSEVFSDTLVAPGLLVAGTDTKYYVGIAENSYRFMPVVLGQSDIGRIHGTDERISVDNYVKMIQFHTRLMQNISDMK